MDYASDRTLKTVQFTLPSEIIEQMKKLSKIRGHSINDEFIEALRGYLVKKKKTTELSKHEITALEKCFEKNHELKDAMDKEVSVAVKKHLKRHTSILK